jgi:hypothetical protein
MLSHSDANPRLIYINQRQNRKKMPSPYFFGYGSLVNTCSHAYAPSFSATAKGWRRAWVAVPERDLCYLSAVPDPDGTIDGLIAPVPPGGWAALDLREAAYERHDQSHQIQHASPAQTVVLYAIDPNRHRPPQQGNPILLSYLDVVIQGYCAVYGIDGARKFFATTAGWQAPILDDRHAPRYARSQDLTAAETALVDDQLAQLGCQRISAESGTTT